MTDEMDLMKRALEAEPLDLGARNQARARLQAYRAASPEQADERPRVSAFRKTLTGGRPRGAIGIGAGIGALAAGAAVVFAVTTTSPPATPRTPASAAPVIESELVALAGRIADEKVSGEASLIVETRSSGGSPEQVTYNLYTDDGAYYFAGDRAALARAVGRGQDLSEGEDHRELRAAAVFAAEGDLTVARTKMVNAVPNYLGLGLGNAERQKIWDEALANSADVMTELGIESDPHPPTGKDLETRVGSALWNNSYEALVTGAGDPQVRAGVLRLLSTIPEVSVEKSKAGSTPTLKLTAAPRLSGGAVEQELTIDAKTGTPLTYVSEPAEQEGETTKSTLEVSRVTVAEVQAD